MLPIKNLSITRIACIRIYTNSLISSIKLAIVNSVDIVTVKYIILYTVL